MHCLTLVHPVQRRSRYTPCSDTRDVHCSCYRSSVPDDDGDDCGDGDDGDDADADSAVPASKVHSRTSRSPALVS